MSDQFTQEIEYLKIRLQEYKNLRDEILERQRTVDKFLDINYIVIAGIITFFSKSNYVDFSVESSPNSSALLFVTLLIVSLCWMIIFSWRRSYEVVIDLAEYLQKFEEEINNFFTGNSLIRFSNKLPEHKIVGWESFLKDKNKKKRWTPDIKAFIFWLISTVTIILQFVFYSQCIWQSYGCSNVISNQLSMISFSLLFLHFVLSFFLFCIWGIYHIINKKYFTYFLLFFTVNLLIVVFVKNCWAMTQ